MSRAYHNIVSLQLPTDAFFTQNKFLERQKKSLCNLTDIWHWSVNKKVSNTYYNIPPNIDEILMIYEIPFEQYISFEI